MSKESADFQLALSEMIRRTLKQACTELVLELAGPGGKDWQRALVVLRRVADTFPATVKVDARGLDLTGEELKLAGKDGVSRSVEALSEVLKGAEQVLRAREHAHTRPLKTRNPRNHPPRR